MFARARLTILGLWVFAGAYPLFSAEPARVCFGGQCFDPLEQGEPVQTHDTDAGRGCLELVQLMGIPRDEWLQGLELAGLDVLQYQAENAYLVWSTVGAARHAAALPFVRWCGPVDPRLKVSPGLTKRTGVIRNIDVSFYNDGDIEATLEALRAAGGRVIQHFPAQPDRRLYDAIVEIDAAGLGEVARIPTVVWVAFSAPAPELAGEVSSCIAGGHYELGDPLPDYRGHLDWLGYDGSGVLWSVTDSGVDLEHPDLNVVTGVNYPGCQSDPPGDDIGFGKHGTPVAGVLAGTAVLGYADGDGFLYGLGVAPGVGLVSQNAVCSSFVSWPPAGGWQVLSHDGLAAGAIGTNNSWGTGETIPHGYQASERTFDLLVRDGDFDTVAVAEPYIVVFAAGNAGPEAQTIKPPSEAKNVIAVGATENWYGGGDINAVAEFSSRGPAVDGRLLPTVVAPGGSDFVSGRGSVAATLHRDNSMFPMVPNTDDYYGWVEGTSFAAPHASGALAVITEWWRDSRSGATPSPAMAKALLVNAAVDIAGAPPIPNNVEGWGRINLARMVRPEAPTWYLDQEELLHSSGDSFTLEVRVADPSQPLKVTLAWSDAPGALGATLALVNNLDLVIEGDEGIFLGNVFADGWSVAGGPADTLNNLENVFLTTAAGFYTVTVVATFIAGDGVPYNGDSTDQDFALVCFNCLPTVFVDGFELGDLSAWSAHSP